MTRTIIDIPEDLLREIDALCKLLGISRAEATRRALRDYAQRNGHVKTEAFGLWTRNAQATEAPP
jgi:metal-responsive CopG/Arc/MetJ family transcriptional regulator